jgi:hypothetical protein
VYRSSFSSLFSVQDRKGLSPYNLLNFQFYPVSKITQTNSLASLAQAKLSTTTSSKIEVEIESLLIR